ncbi:MAG: SDR family NAD(P)-dependent oxidoreductase, partial [Bacteroidota bacterium]|nr:SDR family NAD(P)-dependent oxidoreductase [Bacteroidota bacterium]
MSKILVTGGTGYIGSHTVVELLEKGMEVVIVDNLSNSEREVLDGIKAITGKMPHFEEIDLKDREATYKVFEKHPDLNAIIHFAAFKAVGESVEKPLEYYENNLLSLIHLLEAMKKFEVDHMVFSSSCTVYGEPDELPVTENAPLKKANSPYGNTKQICEDILRDTMRSVQGKGVISLRYFNPIGAHPSAIIGELPLG